MPVQQAHGKNNVVDIAWNGTICFAFLCINPLALSAPLTGFLIDVAVNSPHPDLYESLVTAHRWPLKTGYEFGVG